MQHAIQERILHISQAVEWNARNLEHCFEDGHKDQSVVG